MHMKGIDRQHARFNFLLQNTCSACIAGKGVGCKAEGQAVGTLNHLIQ